MNALLTISSFIFPLITFPYISRILGPIGIGKVSFALSIISYFSVFAQLGIPIYGIRICAQVRDDKNELTRIAQELLTINLIMSAISYLLLFFSVIFIPKLQSDRLLYLVVSFTIILTSIGMEWLYKALEQYTYITIRSLIMKIIALIAMFLLVKKQSDYVIYGGLSVLAASLSNLLNFLNIHKFICLKPIGGYNFKRHLKPIFTFFAMSCATTIYTNLDNIMLGFIRNDEEVGFYNAAVKIKSILVGLVTSLGAVLLPRSAYYIEHNQQKEFFSITRKALAFVFIVACPLVIYFILFAEEVILFLSGEAFRGAILPMQYIMPTLLFIGITNILGMQILVPLGQERVVLESVVIGAIIDVLINWILIPDLGAVGAAIGTLVAEFVVLIVQYMKLKVYVTEIFREIHYGRICLAIFLSCIFSLWVKFLNISNFLILLISAFLYFTSYFLYLLLKKEEVVFEVWKNIISRIFSS